MSIHSDSGIMFICCRSFLWVCDLLVWKRICSFLIVCSIYIYTCTCIVEDQIIRGLLEFRTWISNDICHGLFVLCGDIWFFVLLILVELLVVFVYTFLYILSFHNIIPAFVGNSCKDCYRSCNFVLFYPVDQF